ncbi:class F sortase [Amycolatopsis nigrescens]|uniref:class F sortase n=1 Tax=Amycolatopsis nigrescens TaxID=381445 RepID=UPI00035F2EC9|nr:class F sortase [Amycolatopsis nigrescens]
MTAERTRHQGGPSRRGRVASFLLGATSLLVVEVLAAGVLLWSPTSVVAGSPHVIAAAAPPQVAEKPAAPEAPEAPESPQPQAPPPEQPPPSPAAVPAPSAKPEEPVRGQRPGTIRLPEGGTATLVRKEIVGPNAVLPVPENLGEATWWGAGLGARAGASVFAGHVNWNGRIGPFAELWNVQMNEQVTVVDSTGKSYGYRVTQLVTLHKDELPQRADALFAQGGAHRIVLVTCGGRWQGGAGGYAENRVVIADPA